MEPNCRLTASQTLAREKSWKFGRLSNLPGLTLFPFITQLFVFFTRVGGCALTTLSGE